MKTGDEEIVCGFHGVRALLAGAGVSAGAGEAGVGEAGGIEVLIDSRRRDQRARQLRRELAQAGIRSRAAAREELDELARGVRHQGVIARIQSDPGSDPGSGIHSGSGSRHRHSRGQPELDRLLDQLDHPPLVLILDQVQDPHNLGACLRTADGAGVDAVILPKDGACPVTPSVTRVAAGAAGRLPVFSVANLARAMEGLQERGIWITGADAAAERALYEVDFTAGAAIVMGAEARGLRRLTRRCCDQLARIPMSGGVSSLNVSVAAGLFLFEAARQRAKQ